MRKSSLLLILVALGVVVALVLSCGTGDEPKTNANSGASGSITPTWNNFAQGFFQNYCLRCHSSSVTGAARNGAPDGVNFDTYSDVVAESANIRNEVSTAGMPPTPPMPTTTEDQTLVAWIDAGMPEK